MDVNELRRVKDLEDENARLKRIVANMEVPEKSPWDHEIAWKDVLLPDVSQ